MNVLLDRCGRGVYHHRMVKDFTEWHGVKTRIDAKDKALPSIRQREIWWCSIGVNVGHEEDGKGDVYSRPVLIVRKFNTHVFLGVPLTTRMKDGWHHHRIHFHGKEQCLMITQIRLFDTKRLTTKLGKLSRVQFDAVRAALKDMI